MGDQLTINVYYNSACPVCKAGVEGQMKKESGCPIQWKDVHQQNDLAEALNTELEVVRERLHVVDECGALHVGFDAFLVVWRNTPTELWMYRLFSLPVLRQLSGFVYNLFAALLYRWNRVIIIGKSMSYCG